MARDLVTSASATSRQRSDLVPSTAAFFRRRSRRRPVASPARLGPVGALALCVLLGAACALERPPRTGPAGGERKGGSVPPASRAGRGWSRAFPSPCATLRRESP